MALNINTNYGSYFRNILAKTARANAEASKRFNGKNETQEETSAFQAGEGVVMGHPPTHYTNYNVDMNKPKEEMTLNEYKQYICNIISSLPVNPSQRAYASGTLIIKEEAFLNMKIDAEYEKYVINMLRLGFSVQLPDNIPVESFQVIGGTKEACHGYTG